MYDGNARTSDNTQPVALSASGDDANDAGVAVDRDITREDVSEPAWAASVPQLPVFAPIERPNFRWGKLGGEEFSQTIRATYYEVTRWRRNILSVPSGKAGKEFVRELTRLINAYAQATALESVVIFDVVIGSTFLL